VSITYPDIYSGNNGINLSGCPAVCIKITQGVGYANPYFGSMSNQGNSKGCFVWGYHLLTTDDEVKQAKWCMQNNPQNVPIMVDFEYISAYPNTKTQIVNCSRFVNAYRGLGGKVWLVYLPKWYWQQMGSPSTKVLSDLGLMWVSSNYTTYSDNGVGWQPYGNPPMAPVIWQYTSNGNINGKSPIDLNAFKGTKAQLIQLISNGEGGNIMATLDQEDLVNIRNILGDFMIGWLSQGVDIRSGQGAGPSLKDVRADIADLKAVITAGGVESATVAEVAGAIVAEVGKKLSA
jgi:GH25 family lysozyme M1 (1,4-beta-N-acetylmuramidase)